MITQNTILIFNKKYYQSSGSILRSHMFLQMLKMVARSIAFTSSPQRGDPHNNIKGLQVQTIMQVVFDCILFGKSSLTNSCTWWNEYNFLPKLHKFRPICVPFQIATTYAPNFKYSFVLTLMMKCFHKFQEFFLTHITFFFSVLKLQQYPFKPQFGICDSVTIIAWIITRVEKFGCITLYKHLRACTNYLEMYGKWACINEFNNTQLKFHL